MRYIVPSEFLTRFIINGWLYVNAWYIAANGYFWWVTLRHPMCRNKGILFDIDPDLLDPDLVRRFLILLGVYAIYRQMPLESVKEPISLPRSAIFRGLVLVS